MRTKENLVSFPRQEKTRPFSIESAGVSYCQGDYIITRKNSAIAVFEFVKKGTGTIINNGEHLCAAKGDVYLLKPGSDHTYFADRSDPWEKIWFNLYGGLVDKAIDLYGLRDVTLVKGTECEGLFDKFNDLVRLSLSYDELCNRCAPVFLEIVIRIAEKAARPLPLPKDAATLKDVLDRSIEKSLSIEELAGSIYRSKSQTIRIFKNAYGCTPYDYLIGLKLDRAKTLLTQTNLSVKEIAFRLKFADEHYFSRLFKLKAGVSPEFFRKI